MNKKQEDILIKVLGFKKKWYDDKSGYILQKDCKNNMLRKCHITIDSAVVQLWCKEPKHVESLTEDLMLFRLKNNPQNIEKILEFVRLTTK